MVSSFIILVIGGLELIVLIEALYYLVPFSPEHDLGAYTAIFKGGVYWGVYPSMSWGAYLRSVL
jgi:hypothetical protein